MTSCVPTPLPVERASAIQVATHEPEQDDDGRALCGRVGVPMARHAATCPDCNERLLEFCVRSLGCTPRHGYQGDRKFYQFSMPGELERFGLECRTLPRASMVHACQDALRTLGEWCLRKAGG